MKGVTGLGFNEGGFNEPGGSTGTAIGVLVSDLIYDAYRRAGIMLAPDRSASIPMVNDGLRAMNRMFDGFNTLSNLIWTHRIDIFDTVAGQQSYSLGPGGDWDMAAVPPKIVRANLLTQRDPDVRQPLNILDNAGWAVITYQDVQSYPASMYPDNSMTNGLTRIAFYPIPAAVYGVELYTWQPFQRPVGISDELFLPDGYEEMIVLNLAVRLMPFYRKRMSTATEDQLLIQMAREALGRCKAMNAPTVRLSTDAPSCSCSGGWFDWTTGEIK